MMFVPIVILLSVLFLVDVSEETRYSRFPRISRSSTWYRLRKQHEDEGYMEQCRLMKFWKGQLGYVNVFAFFDASWQYSYRQAIMLKSLKKRLEGSGFSDVWFFVVIASAHMQEDKTENDIEIEAWREISSLESLNILNSNDILFNDLAKDNDMDFIFVQDTPELGVWNNFHASKDQITVVDRCGRITYQMIVPWSILHFPYVKAAILSTYKEDPCGTCDMESTSMYKSVDYEEYILRKIDTEEKELNENDTFNGDQNINNERSKNIAVSSNRSLENEEHSDISTFTPTHVNAEMMPTKSENGEIQYNILNANDTYFSVENPDVTVTTIDARISSMPTNSTTTESHNKIQDHNLLHAPTNKTDNLLLKTNRTVDANKTAKSFNVISKDIEETKEIPSVDQDKVIDSEKAEKNEDVIPIRILMRAPHLHQENSAFKKYTYLILKTGNLDYHEHNGYEKDAILSDQQEIQSDVSGTKINKSHKGQKLIKYVYNEDESPGLYGEVVDYWKNYDDSEYIDQNQTKNGDKYYDDVATTGTDNRINGVHDNKGNTLESSDIDTNKSATAVDTDDIIQSTEDTIQLEEINFEDDDISDINNKEDESRQKLIDHYSKLLPWIYYILNR